MAAQRQPFPGRLPAHQDDKALPALDLAQRLARALPARRPRRPRVSRNPRPRLAPARRSRQGREPEELERVLARRQAGLRDPDLLGAHRRPPMRLPADRRQRGPRRFVVPADTSPLVIEQLLSAP